MYSLQKTNTPISDLSTLITILMKKLVFLFQTTMFIGLTHVALLAQDQKPLFPPDYQVDTRIDNMGYWQKCAAAGLVPVEPFAPVPRPGTRVAKFCCAV